MVKAMDYIFKPVRIEFGQVHVAGGFSSKAAPVVSRSIEGSDNKQHIFVKMSSSEAWLLQATCGKGNKSGVGFARTSLLCILRAHIVRLADGTEAIDAAPIAAAVGHDPMGEITRAQATNAAAVLQSDRNGRARYYRNPAKNCIVTVNVRSRPHEIDPTCTQMRAISLFVVDRKTVWLSLNDVSWAVRYLFDQHRLKGVGVVDDDDEGPSDAVDVGVP